MMFGMFEVPVRTEEQIADWLMRRGWCQRGEVYEDPTNATEDYYLRGAYAMEIRRLLDAADEVFRSVLAAVLSRSRAVANEGVIVANAPSVPEAVSIARDAALTYFLDRAP